MLEGRTQGEQLYNAYIIAGWLRLIWGAIKLILAILIILALGKYLLSSAQARYKVEYENMPAEIRAWYSSRTMTPEATKRIFPKATTIPSCCSTADVVDTQFKSEKEGGKYRDTWFFKDEQGNWKKVPEDIIHWNEHAPGGQPVMFKLGDTEVCFFPPQGAV